MKVTTIKKAGAAALAGAMTLSCASCALFGPNKKEIIEAADTFAGTLLKQDAGKIIKLTTEDEDSEAAEALGVIFDDSLYSDDQKKFIDAVSDTITYEVDEESVEVDKEEASADVTFTMVDYEKALDGDFEDIDAVLDALVDAVLDALEDCEDTKDVEVTIEFEKDDDEWLVSNIDDDKFGDIFEFYIYELNIMPAVEVTDTDCWTGTSGLISEVYFSDDITAYESALTFDVYFNGSLLASDQPAVVYDTTVIWCDYATELEVGEYEIVVYLNGAEITSMSTTVEETVTTEATAAPVVGGGDYASEVSSTDWWLDNGDDTYDVGVTEIELDFYFNVDVSNESFTFDVFDADGNTIESYIVPTINSYSVYCIWDPGYEIPEGGYYIQLFDSDASDANVIGSGYCEVK